MYISHHIWWLCVFIKMEKSTWKILTGPQGICFILKSTAFRRKNKFSKAVCVEVHGREITLALVK